MTGKEFFDRVSIENPNIGAYQIETVIPTEASFILGCYYDDKNKTW